MISYTLQTLTPVHVGSGQKFLRDINFVVENGQVGFIDLNKIVDLIGIEHIPQLTTIIEKKKSITEYLKNGRGLKHIRLEDYCYRVAEMKSINSSSNELKELYHTSLQGASIPGSSLKGAIKTAIWESLATDEDQARWRRDDYVQYKNGREVYKDDRIEKKLFGPNANEKTTRFLAVGDIHFPEIKSEVYEVGIYNAGYKGWHFKNGQSFLAECIPAGSEALFNLKINKDYFELNKRKYPKNWDRLSSDFLSDGTIGLCKIINSYTQRLIGYEIEDLIKDKIDHEQIGEIMIDELKELKAQVDTLIKNKVPIALLRVGGNSGWNFTTGSWIKACPETVLNENDMTKLRKSIQKNREYDMELWPKTRKLTMKGNLMGFVQLSFNS